MHEVKDDGWPLHDEPRSHSLTMEAPPSTAPWARLWRWESLRYAGSDWWLDRVLPHHPLAFVATVVGLSCLLWGLGYAITSDTSAYLADHDILLLGPFLSIHLLCMRVCASLFKRGIGPSLQGLGISVEDRGRVERGIVGKVANLGAIACAIYFIGRDTTRGLLVDPETGLTAFTDPDQWDFGALGDDVNILQLAIWNVEWLVFGYLLWLQIWCLVSITRAVRRTRFEHQLARILGKDQYREFFTLIARNGTICLVFALANLGYVWFTGELFPKARVTTAGEFLAEMSDLLSTGILFVVLVIGFWWQVTLIRRALTVAVNREFAEAGDIALEQLAEPMQLAGTAEDMHNVKARLDATSGLLRAIVFQREVDALGIRNLNLMILKAILPLGTILFRLIRAVSG